MKFKWGVEELKINNVRMVVHLTSGKILTIDNPSIQLAIDSLNIISEKTKMVHVVIKYTNGEKKSVNCESITKTVTWLNLNDVEKHK